MSDDLNLLITFLSTSDTMVKVGICIPHGRNLPEWEIWRYYKELDTEELFRNALPMHVESFCKTFLAVEEIFYIEGKTNER